MVVLQQPELLTAPAATEPALQYACANWAVRDRRHVAVVPNTNVFSWESDLVTVTESLLAHEFEIKTSRADWRSEMRRIESNSSRDTKRRRFDRLSVQQSLGPAYFWLVAAEDVIPDEEAWAFAGLMRPHFWAGAWGVSVVKRAPKRHAQHVDDRTLRWMMRGMALRMYGQVRR